MCGARMSFVEAIEQQTLYLLPPAGGELLGGRHAPPLASALTRTLRVYPYCGSYTAPSMVTVPEVGDGDCAVTWSMDPENLWARGTALFRWATCRLADDEWDATPEAFAGAAELLGRVRLGERAEGPQMGAAMELSSDRDGEGPQLLQLLIRFDASPIGG